MPDNGPALLEGFSLWGLPQPQRISEALTLYRSVSIPELIAIGRSGSVRGGMNRFNFVDRRPLVFFADTLDDRLISQGEHIYRQAYYAAEDSAEQLECAALEGAIAAHAERILAELETDGISCLDPVPTLLRTGQGYGCLRRRLRHRPKYRHLFGGLVALERAWHSAGERHGRLIGRLEREIASRNAGLPATSAVIVTRPLSGAVLYTPETGCGLGEREYGFAPGHVRVGDIDRVMLVKDRVIIPDAQAARLLRELGGCSWGRAQSC